jgi:hypothetical protein
LTAPVRLDRLRRLARLRTQATLGACLLVVVSCATADSQGAKRTPSVRDWTEVARYADIRKDELAQEARLNPDAIERAALTLAEPLTPAEAHDLVGRADVEPQQFEWRQVGTELRGGDAWQFLDERALEYPGMRVTYFIGHARLADWQHLATDRRVWVVDLGLQGNLFDMAVEAGILSPP